ncbi:MAG: hypothetical protein EBS01_12725, partial [Verrucomicrobia bacterium]|nr:hypothetical protein [Verrucomicrobiota bacterium]
MKTKSNSPPGTKEASFPSHYLTLTELAPQGFALIEAQTQKVLCVNSEFSRLLKKTSDQLLGNKLCDLLPENESCTRAVSRVQASGKPECHIEAQSTEPNPNYWSYAVWPAASS